MSDLTLRLKSFAYELATLAVTAVIGYLLSPEFQAVFNQNFGEFAFAGIVFPILIGVVKQIRNWFEANKFGGNRAHVDRI